MKVSAKFFGAVICIGALALSSAAFAQAKDEKKPAGDKPAAKPADVKPADAKPAAKATEEKPAAKAGDKPAAGADKGGAQPSAEDMAKMMQMGMPGEFHAKLKPLVGKWTYTTKYRMSPDAPWQESPGKGEYKWILGGRILVHEVKGNPSPDDAKMGGPFEGFGLTGYDNMTKKYYNVWGDNMGTGVMTSTGTCDSSGKTFTYTGEYNDPMSGQKKTVKSVLKIAGDDKVVYEMYDKGSDSKEYMSLEVSYTRQK